MLAGLIATVLVLGAPDAGAAEKLRVAWNSQYEWKEDGVKNVTLEFTYAWSWKGRDNQEWDRKGRGHVVIVGEQVVRRHYPGASGDMRGRLDEHVGWVLRRFMRRPFAQAFKDADLKGPEKVAGDAEKISLGDRAFFVKDDRLIGEERNIRPKGKPFIVRVEFKTGRLGDGYAIQEATCAYTMDTVRTSWSRSWQTREKEAYPAPASYVHSERTVKGTEEFRIAFDPPRFDVERPVVVNEEARNLLKSAWERRFVLPRQIRIEGEFQRKVDRALSRLRWTSDARGQFQVWGMDNVTAVLDERFAGRGWAAELERTCNEHLRAGFELVKPTPFDEEFKGCGFDLEGADEPRIVRVYGYRPALAFKVEDGAIVGRFDRIWSDEGWWEYKVKTTRDGVLIDRMTREIADQKVELRFKYGRKKNHLVPTRIDALGLPRDFQGGLVFGVATYNLRKLRVGLPDG